MSSLGIKQINNSNAGASDACVGFNGRVNIWRKMSHVEDFSTADLDTNDVLIVTHSLGRKYVNVAVYDDTDMMVIPDYVKAIDESTVEIGLSSFFSSITTWVAAVS